MTHRLKRVAVQDVGKNAASPASGHNERTPGREGLDDLYELSEEVQERLMVRDRLHRRTAAREGSLSHAWAGWHALGRASLPDLHHAHEARMRPSNALLHCSALGTRIQQFQLSCHDGERVEHAADGQLPLDLLLVDVLRERIVKDEVPKRVVLPDGL